MGILSRTDTNRIGKVETPPKPKTNFGFFLNYILSLEYKFSLEATIFYGKLHVLEENLYVLSGKLYSAKNI